MPVTGLSDAVGISGKVALPVGADVAGTEDVCLMKEDAKRLLCATRSGAAEIMALRAAAP